MRVGVLIFPGSNCDDDVVHVSQTLLHAEVVKIWHKDTSLSAYGDFDLIVVPGGFSYGDYLRSGAIARFSPIMQDVVAYANAGGLVWGICNGFQILCEAGLLPGVLLPNSNQKFVCKNIYLKTQTTDTAITNQLKQKSVLKIPVAHADGRYFAAPEVIASLHANDQILFTYSDADGNTTPEANFNGSTDNIAGICNSNRNVFGMMPHPERAAEPILGNTDGKGMFDSLLAHFAVPA
jgi:phosphoribosylformylglycinamidine synthase subunit PurQ / glutaminase